MKCSVEGCNSESRAKGMCQKHYRRNKKHGMTSQIKKSRGPLKDRFWSYVEKKSEHECWEWNGCIGKNGYGRTHENGRPDLRAHRVSYEITKGDIPNGLIVMHTCDNRKCVNPDHLVLGTHKENMHDMISKGRDVHNGLKGEHHSRAKLTENQVLDIRANNTSKCSDLAVLYCVSSATISAIRNRRIWRHI